MSKELSKTLGLCPACGSGDVALCQISVRPYCRECKNFGEVNHLGTMQDSIKKWNGGARE